ncbi:hypothetical protein ACFOG5_24800 [Pedobacter fastidiosus]|uniref:hypothetical protein n=1 Tax=Pedobacter fastidiosus TaxID=2765361 RepID=UPI003623B234
MNEAVKPQGENFYLTDAITDNALNFIDQSQYCKAPFFCISLILVHIGHCRLLRPILISIEVNIKWMEKASRSPLSAYARNWFT